MDAPSIRPSTRRRSPLTRAVIARDGEGSDRRVGHVVVVDTQDLVDPQTDMIRKPRGARRIICPGRGSGRDDDDVVGAGVGGCVRGVRERGLIVGLVAPARIERDEYHQAITVATREGPRSDAALGSITDLDVRSLIVSVVEVKRQHDVLARV